MGEAVAFDSTASNLTPGDRNRVSDVYARSFARARGTLSMRTTLVSRTRGGAAPHGPSTQPDIGDNGAYVAYQSTATNLLTRDRNGHADIVRTNAQAPVGTSGCRAPGPWARRPTVPSAEPTITRSGSMVFFESEATNLQSTVRGGGFFDRNGTGDVFFWAFLSGNVSLQSRDSGNEILNNPDADADPSAHQPHAPARRPVSSYYGNYLLWESAYPLVDLSVAAGTFPGLTPRAAAERSNSDPALNQVYLRYIGPA